jgi:plastocyanin
MQQQGMNMKKTMAAIGALAGIAAMMSWPSQTVPAAPTSEPNSVAIDNFSFTPRTLTVSVGTTVKWTNRDDVPHAVTSDDKKFKSRALDTDEGFSYTFSAPGTYGYYCSIHPHMRGTVVVK